MRKNVRAALMRTSSSLVIIAPPPKSLIAFSQIACEIRSLAVSGEAICFLGD